MVTKSGTNQFKGSVYSYSRNEILQGNSIDGTDIVTNPELSFLQSGATISGPIIKDKLFFFANAEIERRTDPGTNFTADDGGEVEIGESRVSAADMDAIRQRMIDVYDYDPGEYENYNHETSNNKFLMKLNWNINSQHTASFRYSMLDAIRDLPPHGFVLSFNNTGRGPNSSSLPFQNSGYSINNDLHSFAAEVNSIFGGKAANRFFVSYNRFRDFREPFSEDFPTVEIGENGVTYTTLGHEPFSIHNILDQDVTQITNNFNYFMGRHTLTAGINYEHFKFFNSFNIFRHGLFMVTGDLDLLFPGAGYLDFLGATTYSSVDNFFTRTGADPGSADFVDFRSMVGSGPYKGEIIEVAQLAFYAQDEYTVNENLKVMAGLRVDIPRYITEPVANPFSTDSLTLLDENDKSEKVNQAKLPDANPLFSPRIGFNWDVKGDRSMQLRGGTGVFTGRLPFVWIGNVISNPGVNPNITGDGSNGQETDDGEGRSEDEGVKSVLQQSFDLNAMVDDFKWPQVWTTDLALDLALPARMVGTFEMVYSKDLNAIYMRNADVPEEVRYLDDGRPYYTDASGNFELNPDGGAGVYVIDNTDEGYNLTLTGQLRKSFSNGLNTSLAYTYLDAKNNLKSTEIASVLWTSQPVQGDPNKPQLSWSEFGNRHRIVGMLDYRMNWTEQHSTNFAVFFEMAEGNRYVYSGGNRYSFIYSGDVNGDGYGGNDLIYIPKDANDIVLADASEWDALDAFIEQDPYLSENRDKIAERHGLVNPWFTNIDLKILHDFSTSFGRFQFNVDIMNVANLISDNWGVRQVA
ncbi:MAG: TonB-dependent receptor, partial [Candidatus Marinimicrobia bacterium]|nr:TonB-dependent receptor [Candidatus Neomarinimicrobiota bacterium]